MKLTHKLAALSAALISTSVLAVDVETKSLDELYQEAVKEGGTLVVYAGGDTAEQQNGIKAAFEKRFPQMKLETIVDYSKFHDARLDYQIASKNVQADVVQLQTLQDYPRWKAEGVLMAYKPLGWENVYPDFKDQDGAWTGVFVDAFSNVINSKALNGAAEPKTFKDFTNPQLKGKIISTYPNDDDAVLFGYKLAVDKYGWGWLQDLMKNEPHFVRGTQAPADEVEAGKFAATFSTDGSLKADPAAQSQFKLPENEEFVAWAQRAAILKDAKHPAAAKLYLSWLLSKDFQENVWYMWSVRTDVAAPQGYKSIWQYPNANLKAFEQFMTDRAKVEQFRSQVRLFVGEVKGEPSTGEWGLLPKEMRK